MSPGTTAMRFASALLAILVVASTGCGRVHRYVSQRAHRAARTHPARLYIPQPAPDTGKALAGPEGADADGAPLRYVDRVQVRGMLARKQYAQLTQLFEDLQSKFEANPAAEAWPMEAAESFDSGESSIDADLDAWVAASPGSFAPYLARGAHHVAAGFSERGGAYSKDTSAAALAAMNDRFQRALPDVQKVVALHPRAQEPYRELIHIAETTNDRAMGDKAVADAAAACPTCSRVRVTYLLMQTPRWGGSYAAMDAYAQSVAHAGPKTRYLAGYKALDQARTLKAATKYGPARQAIDQACAIGDYFDFLLERAKIERANGDDGAALADVRRADELRPGYPDVLAELADEEADEEMWEPAGLDLMRVLRMDPTPSSALQNSSFVFEGLLDDATDALKSGDIPKAKRESYLASELGPDDPRARQLHNDVVLVGGESVDDLRSAVAKDPGNFEAIQKLDYQLDKQGHAATLEMIPIWTAYIALHPEDGRAYLERGGTYYNNHQVAESAADANKACSLGNNEGCLRAKQLAAGMGAH